jgi:hypothetical protein
MDVSMANRMLEVAFGRLRRDPALSEGKLEAYDQRGTQEHDIRCMVVADVPEVARWWAALPTSAAWPVFVQSEWSKKPLSGIFIRIDFPSGGEPLICFTKWSDILLFRRKGILAALSNSRYSIQELDSEIYLPDTIHFFSYRGVIFAFDWKQFESAVSYKELTTRSALDLWDTFNSAVPITAADLVWKAISKSMRHQNSIIKTFGRTGRTPTLERVAQFISEQGLPISIVDGKLVVDADDKLHVECLITLMADGYVTSDLTDVKLKTLDAEPR